MQTQSTSLAERRVVLAAAQSALSDMVEVLYQSPGVELAEIVGELDRLAASARAAVVAVTLEAQTRVEIAASQTAGTGGWVRAHAPALAADGGAAAVAEVVGLGRRPLHRAVVTAVVSADISPRVGAGVARELDALRPLVRPEAMDAVADGMLEMARADGLRGARALRARLLAEHGLDDALQRRQDAASRLVSLSAACCGYDLGTFGYRLVLDAEGHAVLEAALGALSRPVPGPDGSHDPRPAWARRGQALVEICRRAIAAADRPPGGVKATVVVTIDFDDLRERVHAATTIGSSAGETVLNPETVRRLACDAELLPMVLGSRGEILELGSRVRLFTPAQQMALAVRDRHCSFPGCSIPAPWCDAHHLVHWADGGPTDLTNAALLCGRHHTVVHRDRLVGRVGAHGVEWDRACGSYDRRSGADVPPRFGRPPRWSTHGDTEPAA